MRHGTKMENLNNIVILPCRQQYVFRQTDMKVCLNFERKVENYCSKKTNKSKETLSVRQSKYLTKSSRFLLLPKSFTS